MTGHLAVVSIGPGATTQITPAARVALKRAEVLVGYRTYLDLIASLAPATPREASGMHHEVERAQRAIELTQAGKRVALVCGGDAGVYGMAGLVFQVLWAQGQTVPVTVYPGITAANAAAALLGAPLMSDYAVLSLSDHLVPLEVILQRLDAVARADLVICLYNPRGRHRSKPFEAACSALARWRPPETPVGIVHAAYRRGQRTEIISLGELAQAKVDMSTLIFVGNSQTEARDGRMVTRRGYEARYAMGAPNETA